MSWQDGMWRACWQRLGSPRARDLTEARTELHYALQLVASASTTLCEHQEDYSHTSLCVVPEHAAIGGLPVTIRAPWFRVALRFEGQSLLLLGADDHIVDQLPLLGRTYLEACQWLDFAVSRYTGRPRLSLMPPQHDLPEHPLAHGARFTSHDRDVEAELYRYLANVGRLLQALAASDERTSPTRLWPHHFDLAVLTVYDTDRSHEDARSVGVGIAAGDASYEEPYIYVNPWPPPADHGKLGELPVGHWHTEGFVGAILTGTELSAAAGADAQADLAARFVEAATGAARVAAGVD